MMTFKKLMLTAFATVAMASVASAAAPTVMFLPDDNWLHENSFMQEQERNGKKRYVPLYDEAFVKNSDLTNVVGALNHLMIDNGIDPKTYGTATQIDDEEEDEEAMYEGEDGDELEQTPYEMALNKLRPDIIIRVGWNKNQVGFNYSLAYRLEAVDSYTGKSISGVTGTTANFKTTTPVGDVLVNAANEHMSQFISRLQDHFDDLQANGREITLTCRIGKGSDVNMNSDIDGRDLATVISHWVNDNTVNHAYSTRSTQRNRIQFEQVRIPFRDTNGAELNASVFAKKLRDHLKSYGINSEDASKGLGSGRLYNIKK